MKSPPRVLIGLCPSRPCITNGFKLWLHCDDHNSIKIQKIVVDVKIAVVGCNLKLCKILKTSCVYFESNCIQLLIASSKPRNATCICIKDGV